MKVRIPGRTTLTAPMKKAAVDEAMRQLGEKIPEIVKNVESIILWQLHVQYGFGHDRIMKFYNNTSELMNDMLTYYCYDSDDDAIWLCKHKLKENLGIDIDELTDTFTYKIKAK